MTARLALTTVCTLAFTKAWAALAVAAMLSAGCATRDTNAPPSAANPAVRASAEPAADTGAAPADSGQTDQGQPQQGQAAKSPQEGAAAVADRSDDWYRWRGPEQTGVSREKNLPEDWSPDDKKNLLWVNEVGGMSSPIIMGNRLYTYTRVGEQVLETPAGNTAVPTHQTQEALICADADTGKVLWRHLESMTQTDVPFWRIGWSNVAGDPQTGRVYGLGAQAVFVCLDGQSGEVVWKRRMTEEFGMISTFGGRTPSPTVDEDQVFIGGVSFGFADNARSQHRLFAFNKHTGELNWTAGTGGIPVDAPYNTPVVAVINGERLVMLAAGDGGVHAFQARTGKKVWSFKASQRGINVSLVVEGTRVFVCHDLGNIDSNRLGRVACIEVGDGKPKEVWRVDALEAGYASPALHDGRLYVPNNKATLYCIDTKDGKVLWKKKCGTIAKASPVWADGKIYYPEANGRFWILRDDDKKPEVLSKVELGDKLGREFAIFSSVAVSDGRVFLQTATNTYCIGSKERPTGGTAAGESDPIPPMPQEEPAAKDAEPAHIQVVPADVLLKPGQKVKFTARAFDAKGRLIGEVADPQWAVAQLTIPPPPPRPKELIRQQGAPAAGGAPGDPAAQPQGGGANGNNTEPKAPQNAPGQNEPNEAKGGNAGGNGNAADVAKAAAPAPAPPPAAGPIKAGNLKGQVDESGTFTAEGGPHQAGAIQATVGKLVGEARVRVLPPLPWKIDFEQAPPGKPPLTWLGAGGKFAVRKMEDGNNVLVKLTDIPLYARARTNFGSVDMANYTVQADVMVRETVFEDKRQNPPRIIRKVPNVGILNSRYVLELQGTNGRLNIHVWWPAFPYSLMKEIPYEVKADTWYRLKLTVLQQDGTALVRGKAWPADQPEPQKWMLELEDKLPNRQGNPGLWGFSNEHEIYYDNILVTSNGEVADAKAGR